ncbi:nickel/cobalt transporter [Billgrantia gudaonensis]|uniref:Nickel/cobalt efflux system n=1 Tax=Billgrantia gudaonensis TaxID=376427 RepID=A0A1G8Z3W3_9GAMM|nr:sodium:proton antiporter [Halomonas gudaonensis]SDK09693.1 ABC-type nickel/cobalt efflux system, permease component RcnA [Halomonas gudaonensis]
MRSRRWLLVAAGLAGLVVLTWLAREGLAELSLQLVAWQRELHRALTLAITALSVTPSRDAWFALLGISFAYGVFHAAGPGHGKAVLATYLLSQGGAVRRALALSVAAALLQGMVAIALVVVLVHGLGWVTRQAMGSVVWVEQASFVMVALLGAWLCWRAVRTLRRPLPATTDASLAETRAAWHGHDEHCCHGQHHVAPEQAADWRTALATVAAIGARPCSGAVLLLGAASLLGQFAVGVTAVLTMSLGTALTVSVLAVVSVVARDWAERRLRRQGRQPRRGRWLGWVSLGGGLAILALGVSLAVTGVSQPAAPLFGEPPDGRVEIAPERRLPFGG